MGKGKKVSESSSILIQNYPSYGIFGAKYIFDSDIPRFMKFYSNQESFWFLYDNEMTETTEYLAPMHSEGSFVSQTPSANLDLVVTKKTQLYEIPDSSPNPTHSKTKLKQESSSKSLVPGVLIVDFNFLPYKTKTPFYTSPTLNSFTYNTISLSLRLVYDSVENLQ